MIELKVRRLSIEGIEDKDHVKLYLDIPEGVGVAVGSVRAYPGEQDPLNQLVRIEFVFIREWLEKQAGGSNG